jgi:signal transduction histidine kinase
MQFRLPAASFGWKMQSMKGNELTSIGIQMFDAELAKKKALLDSFIYNCSHSIRSPLKSLEGVVKLLSQYPNEISNDSLDYNGMLRGAAKRLREIVFQFEELRMNADKPLNVSEADFSKMMQRVLLPFESRLKTVSIQVNVHINQKGEFRSDISRIETIVSELISNAINFHDDQKIKREIQVYITASPSSCSIQVHDNGLGIRSMDLGKVFNLFFRGNETAQGSGLGLFIAHQITEKLKGTLTVQSTPKCKTIFSLWVPNRLR